MPHSFDGVKGAAIWWQEHLLDSIIEVILHYFGIVNAQVIHEHICLSFDFVHQLRDEIREGLGVGALLNDVIVY
jgi:hypothetical protein